MTGKKSPPPRMEKINTEETTDTPTTHETKTRFDLEQEILECWNVTKDIELWSQSHSDMSTLSAYYETKFDRLWSTFEVMIREGNIR